MCREIWSSAFAYDERGLPDAVRGALSFCGVLVSFQFVLRVWLAPALSIGGKDLGEAVGEVVGETWFHLLL